MTRHSPVVAAHKRSEAKAALAGLFAPFADPRDDNEFAEWYKWHSAVHQLGRLLLIDTRQSIKARVLMAMIVPDDSWLPFLWPMPGYAHAQIGSVHLEHLSPRLRQLALETIIVVKQHLHGTPHAATFLPNNLLIELMIQLPEEEADMAFAHYYMSDFMDFQALVLRQGVPHHLQLRAYDRLRWRHPMDYAQLVWQLVREPRLPCSEELFTTLVDAFFASAKPGTLHTFFSDSLTAIFDIVTDYEAGARLVRRLLSGDLACPGGQLCVQNLDPRSSFRITQDYCGRLSTETDTGLLLVWALRRRYADEADIAAGLDSIISRANGRVDPSDKHGVEMAQTTQANLCRP